MIQTNTVGEKRNFFVINTRNQIGQPHVIEAELVYQSDIITVWFTDTDQLNSDLFFECIQKVETFVIPRIETLWGKPADIDGDGRTALLFSHTLNDEQLAIGFFNPADFFVRNDDIRTQKYGITDK